VAASVATRERILDEAVRLFARKGFKATTVADIESAAGLTVGAGGVFHHFATKRAILVEALERRFAQLEALNQIRGVIPDLGNRRAELRLFARYVLDQMEDERELMALVLREASTDAALFADAVRRLFDDRERSFACWLHGLSPHARPTAWQRRRARMVLGSLAYGPTIDALVDRQRSAAPTDDDLDAWVDAALVLLERDADAP
jgi:AcrR family transcriptional regulator